MLEWAINTGKLHENANNFYGSMIDISGVAFHDGTFEDFQRYFKCKNVHPEKCNDAGLQFPTKCSVPPCNQCSVDQGIRNLSKKYNIVINPI